MFKHVVIGVVLSFVASPSFAQGNAPRNCLHGVGEAPANRARRQQAIDYAVKVNVAENAVASLSPRGYRPPNELTNLPPLPAGFDLQFHSDERSYAFSLKDTRDACHYALFSDQDKLIYEAIPRTDNGVILPAGTK